MVVPDAFEEFAAVEGVEARIMKNRVAAARPRPEFPVWCGEHAPRRSGG